MGSHITLSYHQCWMKSWLRNQMKRFSYGSQKKQKVTQHPCKLCTFCHSWTIGRVAVADYYNVHSSQYFQVILTPLFSLTSKNPSTSHKLLMLNSFILLTFLIISGIIHISLIHLLDDSTAPYIDPASTSTSQFIHTVIVHMYGKF